MLYKIQANYKISFFHCTGHRTSSEILIQIFMRYRRLEPLSDETRTSLTDREAMRDANFYLGCRLWGRVGGSVKDKNKTNCHVWIKLKLLTYATKKLSVSTYTVKPRC